MRFHGFHASSCYNEVTLIHTVNSKLAAFHRRYCGCQHIAMLRCGRKWVFFILLRTNAANIFLAYMLQLTFSPLNCSLIVRYQTTNGAESWKTLKLKAAATALLFLRKLLCQVLLEICNHLEQYVANYFYTITSQSRGGR